MTMNSHKTWPDNWHSEFVDPDKQYKSSSVKIEAVLYSGESEFQKISVVMTSSYGRALLLDRVMVKTERDSWLFNEMMGFLPLGMVNEPRDVLIVGGGDGGVAGEILKHPTVENVVIVERDQRVVDISMRYFEDSSVSIRDSRVEVIVGDPLLVTQRRGEKFDVIIVDMFSDMRSPAHKVVAAELLHGLQYILKTEGVICYQQPSPLVNDTALREQMRMFHRYYPSVGYALNIAPTFPQGSVGYALMSRQEGVDFSVPKQGFGLEEARELGLRCYNTEVHQGSFMCVPSIVRDMVSEGHPDTPSTETAPPVSVNKKHIYSVQSMSTRQHSVRDN